MDGLPPLSRPLRIRSFLGITQRRFAFLLGISCVSLGKWESNRAPPSDYHGAILDLLEDAIDVHPAAELLRRLEQTGARPRELMCFAVWLGCPEGPPSSLARPSSPELDAAKLDDAGPPSSSATPASVGA